MPDLIKWEIEPYKKVGPIAFGMLQPQVEELLGPATFFQENGSGERDERRPGVAIRYSKLEDGVVEVEIDEHIQPIILKIDIMASESPLAVLQSLDSEAYECVGDAVFMTLGVSVPMSIDRRGPGETTMAVIARGRFDGLRHTFKPLSSAKFLRQGG